MQSPLLKETQERHYQSVRTRIHNKICKSILCGSSCTTHGCPFFHSIQQFKTETLCEFGKFCTVQGCPFPHKIDQIYNWEEMNEIDLYDLLRKNREGDSTIRSYQDLLLIDNARKLRASSPSLDSLSDLLEVFQLETTKETDFSSISSVVSIENELQRLVPSSLTPSDEKDGLILYHQNNVNNYSSKVELECRGLIVKDKTLLVKTFPTAREISVGHPNYYEWVSEALPSSIIIKSYEGSLLRVWKCPGDTLRGSQSGQGEDQWRISTVRKIDATGSRWNSSPSFSQRLIESIQLQTGKDFSTFCYLLNPDYVYTFWLTNDPQTKSICKNDAQHLYSLGCFDRLKDFEYHLCTFNGIPFPPRIEKHVFTPEELELALCDRSNSELTDLKIQGYIILSLQGEMLKVSSNKYRDMYLIRGRNVSNKFVKYLELHDQPSRESFVELYPEETEHFQQLDRKMTHLVSVLHMLHQKDVTRKRLPLVEKEEYKVYRQLFTEKPSASCSKDEIYHLLCKSIRSTKDHQSELGLDVLRCLERQIQMLPSPNLPQTVPIDRAYYPQEIRYGNRGQYKKKNIHHIPSHPIVPTSVTFSSSIETTVPSSRRVDIQFGNYSSSYKTKMTNRYEKHKMESDSPRIHTPSPTLSPSTTPISSPVTFSHPLRYAMGDFDGPSPVTFSKNIQNSMLQCIRPVMIQK